MRKRDNELRSMIFWNYDGNTLKCKTKIFNHSLVLHVVLGNVSQLQTH